MVNSSSKIVQILKEKKLIFAAWNATNIHDNPYQNWYLPLKDTLGEVTLFDTAKNYFRYGKKRMQEKLLHLIEQQQPHYLFTLMIYDELDPLFYQEVKRRFPKIIILSLFSDDDWRYEDYSRYYDLFIDYPIINITDVEAGKSHKKDGLLHFSLSLGINCKLFKPLGLEKQYDVSFVGRPNKSRVEYIQFLLEKGIAVKVWGDGWENYPEVAPAYQGHASAEDLARIDNTSKINLSFTQGGYGKLQMKGRVFETAASRAFTLVEHFEAYAKYYQKGKELAMFNNKEDLFKKIQYYLKHEKERERIADAAYQITLKKYNKHRELLHYFQKIFAIEKELREKTLPSPQGKIAILTKKDFLNEKKLQRKIADVRYVTFSIDKVRAHPLMGKIQAYAIEKTNKPISCCDAYFSDLGIPHYLLLKAKQASVQLNSEAFQKCIQLPQLLVEKLYFLKHLEEFKMCLQGQTLTFLNDKTTAFVSIPLVTLHNIPRVSLEDFKKLFQMKFLDKLYSLWYQKKLFAHSYAYCLAFHALKDKNLRNVLLKNLQDQKKIRKVKEGI